MPTEVVAGGREEGREEQEGFNDAGLIDIQRRKRRESNAGGENMARMMTMERK